MPGRAPVVIDVKNADPQTMTVFEDSTLVVRGEPGVVETRVEGPISPIDQKAADQKAATPQGPSQEHRWTIHGDGKATILRGGAKAAEIAFAVTPTGVPTIKLTEDAPAPTSAAP